MGEVTEDKTFVVRSTLTGAGATFLGGAEGEVRVFETDGDEGFTVVLGRRFREGVVVVLGFGVGAVPGGVPSPAFIPSSDNNDFLFDVEAALPTVGLSVIYFVENKQRSCKKKKKRREATKSMKKRGKLKSINKLVLHRISYSLKENS